MKFDPLLRQTMKHANYIVATSNAARRLIPEKYQHKTLVAPEGITRDKISPNGQSSTNYIFSSGRLVPYKAFDLLIRAFSETRDSGNTELWITGSGPDTDYLNDLASTLGIAERVRLLGNVDREENLQLMRKSLFCVFPALNEAFGSVNLEAMAMGKTVIVTDWGGPADLISNGVDGYKIPARSEEEYVAALRSKIDHLLTHPADLNRMEAKRRTKVAK